MTLPVFGEASAGWQPASKQNAAATPRTRHTSLVTSHFLPSLSYVLVPELGFRCDEVFHQLDAIRVLPDFDLNAL